MIQPGGTRPQQSAAVSGATGQAFGRYRLLEHLGRGGMAEVFKAKSYGVEGFEKVLVIKRIVPELAVHQEFVDRFVQEAKLAVRLSHANIVQVFDLGRIEPADDGPPDYYIAMEYVPGVDLATWQKQLRREQTSMPLALAVFVAAEVAKALDHAHRRQDERGEALGIVHRDISPQNILLSWDGDVKVTDFGIAKAHDTITRDEQPNELEADRAMGKLSYLSPEQARGQPTDARSDLFSLGVVLYEMITGANPFFAPTTTETIRRIGVGEYPPVNLVRPETPEALVEIVDHLLATDPAERFDSAGNLCETLLAYCYRSGERFGANELAAALAALRQPLKEEALEPASVLAEPLTASEKTPVEVPRSTTAPATHETTPHAGERREVSALVLSIAGRKSTEGTEKLLATVQRVLERHDAWIHELSTAQVVAIFGLGDTDGRDANAAVRAGLVLVRERHCGVVPSAGIHSGPISVDVGGVPAQDERLVALLATAQSLARTTEGRVAVSQLTGRLVRHSFTLEPLPDSGRIGSETGHVVHSALAPDTLLGRFVGRREELRELGTILAAATKRTPQLVLLRGETGVGKTRLLAEAKRRLERGQFNLAFYSASCPLGGANRPWSGLRAMLHVLCGTQEDDSPRRILEVRPRLRALGLRDEQAAAVLGLLGAPQPPAHGETRALLRAGFKRMVASLCKDQLHCFAWDDAQAIDTETLEALLRTFQQGSNLRAAFIVASRTEMLERLLANEHVHAISLSELIAAETEKFLEARLGARSVPASLLSFVRNCAGGHPLFLEELLRELSDSGAVRVFNGKVTAQHEEQMTAPRTLRTLVASRVSRLPKTQRELLQAIAIVGVPAFTPVLAAILEQPLRSVDRNLFTLRSHGLVRRTGPTKVRFGSPLYRDIVLDAMPVLSRQQMHARAAETYQQFGFPEAGGDTAERIAQHLLEAGEQERAVDFFCKSAQQRLTHGQLEASLRAMLRTLELADPSECTIRQLLEWLSSLSETVSRVRAAPGLKEAVADALEQIDQRGSATDRARAHIDVARALGSVNLFDDAYECLEQGGLDQLTDQKLTREALVVEIYVAIRQGLFVRAAQAADRLEQLGPIDDIPTLLAISQARASTGQADLALELVDRVDQLGEPQDALEATSRRRHRLLIYFNARNFVAAAREAKQFAKLARIAGLRYDTAAALHNLGDALTRMDDHGGAYAAFVESLELTRLIEHDRLSALNQMHIHYLDGLRNADDADAQLKKLIRYADANGYLWDVLEGRLLLARLAVARLQNDEARKQLDEVIAMAEQHGHELIIVDGRQLLSELAEAATADTAPPTDTATPIDD